MLVELMGGNLQVDRQLGQDTRFWFELETNASTTKVLMLSHQDPSWAIQISRSALILDSALMGCLLGPLA
ncbi:hypothetical protein SeMB42_g01275 [Synchytrium endobioticum]|nr:hypothetical protein SeMB42_g01275 [Synchytrium endobioticum]